MLSFEHITLQRSNFCLQIGAQHLAPGSRLTLMGPSGGGKSSLLRALLGLEPAAQVHGLRWMNTELNALPLHQRPFAWLPQELGLWPHLSAAKHVAFARTRGQNTRSQPGDLALLQSLNLLNRAQALPEKLSGGERQRLACARVLAQKPAWAILDEPFSNLDLVLACELEQLFSDLSQSSGMGLIQVSHHVRPRLAGELFWVIEQGQLTQAGHWNQLLTQPATPWIQRFVALQYS